MSRLRNTVEDVENTTIEPALVSPEKEAGHVQKRARHLKQNHSTDEAKMTFAQLMKGSVGKDEKKLELCKEFKCLAKLCKVVCSLSI